MPNKFESEPNSQQPELTPHEKAVERIAKFEIDETPAYQDQFEQKSTLLYETLDKLTDKDINEAEARLKKIEDNDKTDNIITAINALRTLKKMENKKDVLVRLSKFSLADLANAKENSTLCKNQAVEDAIHFLCKSCEALVEIQASEDRKKQQEINRGNLNTETIKKVAKKIR